MPISPYLKSLRRRIGGDLLLVPSVTAIIYDHDRRILLVQHIEAGVWVPPGGSLEPHESPANAVVREAWEETGLWVEPSRILGVYGGPEFLVTYANGDQVSYLMTVFECVIRQGELKPDGLETLALGYFAESELDRLYLPRWAHLILPDLFHPPRPAHFKAATWQPPAGNG